MKSLPKLNNLTLKQSPSSSQQAQQTQQAQKDSNTKMSATNLNTIKKVESTKNKDQASDIYQLSEIQHGVDKFYSPKQHRTLYKVDLSSLSQFRASSQSTNDSLEDKKTLCNSEIIHSRKSTLQSPISLSNIFSKLDGSSSSSGKKQLTKSQLLLNPLYQNKISSNSKRNSLAQHPLEQIEEIKKLNFKEYMEQKIKKKGEMQRSEKIRQKLMKMNTPFEEQIIFPSNKLFNNSLQKSSLPSINKSNETAQKFIPIEEGDFHNYNANFKNIQKIVDSNSHFQIENTLEIAMLSATQNTNIMPKKLGILNKIQMKNEPHLSKHSLQFELDLSNQNITEGYSQMIQQILQHPQFSQLQTIKLKNSNLTTNSLLMISNHLPSSIREIDLERNHLGSHDFSFAVTPLLSPKTYPSLRILNIENNRIGDLGFHSILAAVLKSSLSVLNLSNNNLTDASSECVSQLLKESQEINEVYLHWNKFSSQGGIAIANGIEQNISLQVLDLSYNGLGNPKGVKCGLKIIKSCSGKFSQIKHLDLSFNMISKEETQEISNFLQKNNSIFGLHYLGNQGDWILDSRGFLVQTNSIENARDEQIHYSKQRIQGLKCVKQKQKLSTDIFNQDICWVCDGWSEVKFEITAESSSTFAKHPVFLHLDFENYRPHYMDADPNDPTKFVLKRMCPPNRRIQFFFSDPTQKVLYYSHDYPTMSFLRNQLLGVQFYNRELTKLKSSYASPQFSSKKQRCANFFQKQFFKLQYLDTTVLEYQEPFLVNWIETSPPNNSKLFSEEYDILTDCRPRQPETFFKINFTNEWTFEKSIFQTYIRDSDDLLDKCFEADWESSRIEKILGQYCTSQQMKDQCKEILKKEYNLIRCTYKHFASLGIIGDIPCISQNAFSNISMKMKLTDGKGFKISDLDYNFITANSSKSKEKNYRNPDKSLVRFEFLEVITRIAIDKYIRPGTCKNALESLELFFGTKLVREKFEEIDNPQEWRDTKYWIEECDIILQNNIEMIQELWNKWANSRKSEKRGFQTAKTMSIYEFSDMVKQYNLLDDFLNERDIPLSYNLAMMTQVEELTSDRYIQMTFVEFLESLARLADKKSMEPLGTVPGSYELSERQEIRLEFKLEAFLDLIKQRIIQQNKEKQSKQMAITIKEKQAEEQEVVRTPLVPSVQLSNIKQRQILQFGNTPRRYQELNTSNQQSSNQQFSQDSIANDY